MHVVTKNNLEGKRLKYDKIIEFVWELALMLFFAVNCKYVPFSSMLPNT